MTRIQRHCRLGGALLGALLSLGAAAAETLTVHLDEATLAAMPERASTIVVGNPMIADVSLQGGRVLVVTGKSYGTTNLIALDASGAVLMERTVQVKESRDNTVFLYRGINRETYNCTPNCEPRIHLGDTPNYFTATLGQSSARSALARNGDGAAAAPAGPR